MIGLVDGNNFFVSCERVFNRRLVGKPVAVLSNNDGCCVALSPEMKALGVTRGAPYFELGAYVSTCEGRDGKGIFLSSNHELYADLSRRLVMTLRTEAVEVEQYSVDEAFVHPPASAEGDLVGYGCRLREKILQWVGIPCGIGFARTKTLAKIANHIGKKLSSGVFVMPSDPTDILTDLPASEVWGVGRRLRVRLGDFRIRTARDLREADDDLLRSIGGVSLVRTAMELRGTPCGGSGHYDETPESITCSRSFGKTVTTREDLAESIAAFTSSAAVRLRKHGLRATGCCIYAQFDASRDKAFSDRTVIFPHPTDETNEMLSAISREMSSLYTPGARYRKSGMTFFGLESADAPQQGDLFAAAEQPRQTSLYKVVDALNRRFGKDSVVTASEGLRLAEKSWKMRHERSSNISTVDFARLPVVT